MTTEIAFSRDEVDLFERDLVTVDPQLKALATDFGCDYKTTGGRGWPGRRIRRRRGMRTYELKLILNPNYLEDQHVHYELREQWMYEFGEILTKMLSHRLIATVRPGDDSWNEIGAVAGTHLLLASKGSSGA